MKAGKAELKSAGPLAFAPDGVLLVGDSAGAAIFALDTGDSTKARAGINFEIKAINEKIAALLGTTPDQIMINDVAVNPMSKKVYIRSRAAAEPKRYPVILRPMPAGKLTEVSLTTSSTPRSHSRCARRRGQGQPRQQQAHGSDHRPRLRRRQRDRRRACRTRSSPRPCARFPIPSTAQSKGASIEIFHGAHGRFETNAPVRTFVPYDIDEQAAPARRLHLHAAGEDSGVGSEAGRQGEGHHHRRTRQSQPAARHDRLQEGRQGLHPDGEQQPRRDEAAGREAGDLRADHRPGPRNRAFRTRRSRP